MQVRSVTRHAVSPNQLALAISHTRRFGQHSQQHRQVSNRWPRHLSHPTATVQASQACRCLEWRAPPAPCPTPLALPSLRGPPAPTLSCSADGHRPRLCHMGTHPNLKRRLQPRLPLRHHLQDPFPAGAPPFLQRGVCSQVACMCCQAQCA